MAVMKVMAEAGKRTGKRAAVKTEADYRTKATDQAHGQQEAHGHQLPRATVTRATVAREQQQH
jgi:hypothetical protein